MPPSVAAEPETKRDSALRGLGNPTLPRQRTLDMFLGRSGSSHPSSSHPAVPPRRTSMAQPSLRPSFAVVLNSTPNKGSEGTPMRTVEDDADDLIISDLSPQFGRPRAQTTLGESLAKPALPATAIDEPETASPEATPPPQPRKRGRPKGFRPGPIGKKMLQEENPATGPRKLRPDRPKTGSMYVGKRRGRPPKSSSPQPRTIYKGLNPHFNVFICEWRGCQAELHNFATLQKHVLVVHARNLPYQCRWAECAERQPPHEFPTSADLKSHLEDLHMLPIAWQVGDGPQVSFKRYDPDEGAELPDYLFDKTGNQITPSIRDQREEDFYTWRNNRRRLKDLLLLRDQNMLSEEEDNRMGEMVEGG